MGASTASRERTAPVRQCCSGFSAASFARLPARSSWTAFRSGRAPFLEDAGVLIENPSFVRSYSGKVNLVELAAIRNTVDEARVDEMLGRVGLDPFDERPVRAYSLGMRQRLGIAAALLEYPSTILLDEPVNALDPAGVDQVAELLREARAGGALVVVACHDSEEIEALFDETLSMAEGKLYDGGARDH